MRGVVIGNERGPAAGYLCMYVFDVKLYFSDVNVLF